MRRESDFNTPVEWHQNRSLQAMSNMSHFSPLFPETFFLFLLRVIEITIHMTNNKVPQQKKAAATSSEEIIKKIIKYINW